MRLNGLDFHVELAGDGPPLLALHGFTGSVRAWDELRPSIAAFARCIFIDALGHGQSAAPPVPERYSLDCSTRDLVALLDALDLPAVDVLGYSMGGRAALHFAVHAPERVRALILESASPGLADAAARRERAAVDAALAERIEQAGITAFVAEWERQPLLRPAAHLSVERRARQHAQRLANEPHGLANSLRGMGTGQQVPLWSRLPEVERPVLLVVGEQDARYGQIAARMQSALPRADLAVVPQAGHTVHLDQPARFVALLKSAVHRPALTRN
jgi:2-succinyl-6-hydroxy-2,4-cyclohexadiene-1-carboxylate synthase